MIDLYKEIIFIFAVPEGTPALYALYDEMVHNT
jgi:hypothetical protein